MKSVGEVMAIGRTFCESVQKAARSLENGYYGIESLYGFDLSYGAAENKQDFEVIKEEVKSLIKNNDFKRLFLITDALRLNFTVEE
jgi:Carbamoylphosphate synthase large subunit (split gene in MJ)